MTVADDAVFDRSLLLCDPMEDMEVIFFIKKRERESVCVCVYVRTLQMRKIGRGKHRERRLTVKFDFLLLLARVKHDESAQTEKKERYPLTHSLCMVFTNLFHYFNNTRATRGVKDDDGILCVDFFVSIMRDFYEVHG